MVNISHSWVDMEIFQSRVDMINISHSRVDMVNVFHSRVDMVNISHYRVGMVNISHSRVDMVNNHLNISNPIIILIREKLFGLDKQNF